MKLLIVAIAISLFSVAGHAKKIRGGDMPFPIGKIIDFPKDDGKGIWKDELKKKIIRLRPLKGVLPDGTILVQMLGLQNSVIAEGLGEIGDDKVLRARLEFVATKGKVIDIQIANLCADVQYDNTVDKPEYCENPVMWASVSVPKNYHDYKKGVESFEIRRTSMD